MRFSVSFLLLGLAAVLVVTGCNKATAEASKPNDEAAKFLRWSMNQNAALASYKAAESWSATAPVGKTEQREISYERPNKFKITTTIDKGECLTSVSDGAKMVEIAQLPGGGAVSSDAPQTLAGASGDQISHPLFNGSMLYQFFGGSDNFDALVDQSAGPVQFGDQAVAEPGEQAKTVKFHSAMGYGDVEVIIGTKTGLVYQISYDGLAQMLKDTPAMRQYGDNLPSVHTTETFSNIKTGIPLTASVFDTKPPKGIKVRAASDGSNAPVPIGSPAPDIVLTSLDGKKVKLSSFRGKVVLIDFWATWCPPCRKGLPITNKIHELYDSKGLHVLAVSNEDAAKISAFVKDNKYTFAAYQDANSEASKKYNIEGIPCTVIIDAKGRLSSYLVGLRPESEILDNLKKAGLNLGFSGSRYPSIADAPRKPSAGAHRHV
ncbi:MAG TPA: TlpA family protein disulfide reductase [Fimbriimonadaceae bacterium]|nr:TlpA family protein disulfide reductase [Fimbriimonadaceae bacterium]